MSTSIDSVLLGEKEDIYQFGLILLEVITGKPPGSNVQLDSLRAKVNRILLYHLNWHADFGTEEVTNITVLAAGEDFDR